MLTSFNWTAEFSRIVREKRCKFLGIFLQLAFQFEFSYLWILKSNIKWTINEESDLSLLCSIDFMSQTKNLNNVPVT